METQHGIVGLHHGVGDFGRRNHRESLHDSWVASCAARTKEAIIECLVLFQAAASLCEGLLEGGRLIQNNV